jgi:hypothetical protein
MLPVTSIGAASKQVATHRVSVLRARGTFLGASDGAFLQFFDSKVAADEGAAPIIPAIPITKDGIFFVEEEISNLEFLAGCYVCVSSTRATKTLSADTMDICVELADPEVPASVTVVGNLSSAVTGLQVWTEAAGTASAKRLIQLEVDATNMGLTSGAVAYIMGFAKDTNVLGDVPVFQIPIVQAQILTGKSAISFGLEGRDMASIDAVVSGTAPNTRRYGCTIAISTTTGTLTLLTAGTVRIRAEYL